jgi:hypothetical protein
MPFGIELRGEHMPDYALLVYNIGHPTREQTKGVGNTIQLPDLASLVAEQGEREAVFSCKAPVRLHRVGANPYNLGIELAEFLVIVPKGAGFLGTPRSVVLGAEEQNRKPL